MIRWILIFCLVFQNLPARASGAESATSLETAMRFASANLAAYASLEQWVAQLKRPADREYFRKELGTLAKRPMRVQYIERNGISVSFGGDRITVFAKDLRKSQFRVLAKDFVFDPAESAEQALKRMKHTVTASSSFSLLEPRAEAIGLVGLAIGYVAISAAAWAGCTLMNVSDWKTCGGYAVVAPPALAIGAVIMVGAVVGGSLGLVDANGKPVYLDVTKLECATPKDKSIRATVLDAEKKNRTVEVHFKSPGIVDRVDVVGEGGKAEGLFLKDDFSIDETRSSELVKDGVALENAKLRARATEGLVRVCADSEAREALSIYLKRKAAGQTISVESSARRSDALQ